MFCNIKVSVVAVVGNDDSTTSVVGLMGAVASNNTGRVSRPLLPFPPIFLPLDLRSLLLWHVFFSRVLSLNSGRLVHFGDVFFNRIQ